MSFMRSTTILVFELMGSPPRGIVDCYRYAGGEGYLRRGRGRGFVVVCVHVYRTRCYNDNYKVPPPDFGLHYRQQPSPSTFPNICHDNKGRSGRILLSALSGRQSPLRLRKACSSRLRSTCRWRRCRDAMSRRSPCRMAIHPGNI